jgi:hypothetical protein
MEGAIPFWASELIKAIQAGEAALDIEGAALRDKARAGGFLGRSLKALLNFKPMTAVALSLYVFLGTSYRICSPFARRQPCPQFQNHSMPAAPCPCR